MIQSKGQLIGKETRRYSISLVKSALASKHSKELSLRSLEIKETKSSSFGILKNRTKLKKFTL